MSNLSRHALWCTEVHSSSLSGILFSLQPKYGFEVGLKTSHCEYSFPAGFLRVVALAKYVAAASSVYLTVSNKASFQHVSSHQSVPALCLLKAAQIPSWSPVELQLNRFSVDRCSAGSDVQSKHTQVIQMAEASTCQQFSLQGHFARTMLCSVGPHVPLSPQHNNSFI